MEVRFAPFQVALQGQAERFWEGFLVCIQARRVKSHLRLRSSLLWASHSSVPGSWTALQSSGASFVPALSSKHV
jgi:hypothetical protein